MSPAPARARRWPLLLALLPLAGALHASAPPADFVRLQASLQGHDSDIHIIYPQLLQDYRQSPDFACRQPAQAAYFARQGWPPAAPETCAGPLPLRLPDRGQGIRLHWLDPARVSEIQLLFIGQQGGGVSRYGHVALRLVVCPDTRRLPEDCALNVDDHIALGFQAHVDDSQISLWRGIAGGYRARLNAQSFMDTYEQYASGEFREVHALPLRLDEDERRQLLAGLVQTHWTHDSDYRFFTRNCATLLQDSLAALWPDYAAEPALQRRFLRPDRFFAALRASPLAQAEVLQDLREAERNGHYFPSNEAAFRAAAHHVHGSLAEPFFRTLDDYVATPASRRRAVLLEDGMDARTRSARILLEEWALLRAEKDLLAASTRLWELNKGRVRYKGRRHLSVTEQALLDDCVFAAMTALLSPPPQQPGIPATAALPPASRQCDATQRQQLRALLQEDIRQADSAWLPLFGALRELDEILTTLGALRDAPASTTEPSHAQPG